MTEMLVFNLPSLEGVGHCASINRVTHHSSGEHFDRDSYTLNAHKRAVKLTPYHVAS